MPAGKVKRTHPRVKDAQRPYRLWDPRKRRNIAHRAYNWPIHAHRAAMFLMGPFGEKDYMRPGAVIEVYNAHNALLIGVYVRKLGNVIEFHRIRADIR